MMFWAVITLTFSLLVIVALYGDYEEKELKKDYEKYKEVIYGSDNTFKRENRKKEKTSNSNY